MAKDCPNKIVCNACGQEEHIFRECKEKGGKLSYAEVVSSECPEGISRASRTRCIIKRR